MKRDRIRMQLHCLVGASLKRREKNEKQKESMTLTPKPYMAPLPFPQRFAKAKLDS